jgi:NADPH:quinone reductase-like Zn-dependent oxidoreductase
MITFVTRGSVPLPPDQESSVMRAFIVPEFGVRGSVGERPMPEPTEGQLLIRVKAAGVNAMDPIFASGAYRDYLEHRLPLTPGSDYAGTVEATGPDVAGFQAGDEVYGDVGKPFAGEGSFAELATVSAGLAARRPDGLTPEQAAAIPRAGGTALAEVEAAGIGAGDTVVIVGAAGGVGGFATQLANRRGARVIALTSAANADYVRSLGAVEVIDYAADDALDQVRRLAPDGAAAVIDQFHDAAGLVPIAAWVRPGGTIVSPIAMGGDQALAGLPVTFQMVQAATERAAEIGELVASGELTLTIETLPFSRAAEALQRQASRTVRGKLVLLME